MTLGSTQLLTEISTRDIFWGEGGVWLIVRKHGVLRACKRISFLFFFYTVNSLLGLKFTLLLFLQSAFLCCRLNTVCSLIIYNPVSVRKPVTKATVFRNKLRILQNEQEGSWLVKNRITLMKVRWIVRYIGRDSSVGIATRYGLDAPRSGPGCGRDIPEPSTPALGPTQPYIKWVPGLSLG